MQTAGVFGNVSNSAVLKREEEANVTQCDEGGRHNRAHVRQLELLSGRL